ncbi:MAG: type II toxin-antitoxin system VapC family toxin [Candidatus Aminicenantes bacterium]|nr:type II toxin-antitoxin system VapC family toxin [Candidatus Aminicenantes bacterium]
MIVVDTNIIAYLFVEGENSETAEGVLLKDPHWAAPFLWRSEFRNVLAKCLAGGSFGLETAIRIIEEAERLMAGAEYDVASADVLSLAASAGCSADDAEFVSLARGLGVAFVTLDSRLIKDFPETAVPPERFLNA